MRGVDLILDVLLEIGHLVRVSNLHFQISKSTAHTFFSVCSILTLLLSISLPFSPLSLPNFSCTALSSSILTLAASAFSSAFFLNFSIHAS